MADFKFSRLMGVRIEVFLLQVLVGVCVFLFTDSHTSDAATDWASVVLPILPSADLPQAPEGRCWGA